MSEKKEDKELQLVNKHTLKKQITCGFDLEKMTTDSSFKNQMDRTNSYIEKDEYTNDASMTQTHNNHLGHYGESVDLNSNKAKQQLHRSRECENIHTQGLKDEKEKEIIIDHNNSLLKRTLELETLINTEINNIDD
jgi:hypothetical protein